MVKIYNMELVVIGSLMLIVSMIFTLINYNFSFQFLIILAVYLILMGILKNKKYQAVTSMILGFLILMYTFLLFSVQKEPVDIGLIISIILIVGGILGILGYIPETLHPMKIGQIFLSLGSLTLLSSLLIFLSVPTSPIAPVIGSLSIIFIMQGIFMIKEYDNMTIYVAFSIIIIAISAILSFYNASLPINGSYRGLFYIFIGIFILWMFLIIYGFTRRLKNPITLK
jgi:hypothetical protein